MLVEFNQNYFKDVAHRIEKQQIDYGLARIHSHRHISRCLIYASWIIEKLNLINDLHDNLDLLFAISYHDIGRVQEGVDNTNYQASLIAESELIKLNIDNKTIESVKHLIQNKDNSNDYSIKRMILHDVDCYDIMRPSTGRGGVIGFDKNYLCLFKNNIQIQSELTSKCFELISITENEDFENINCLRKLLNL
jgi:hypothetical protein